MSSEETPENPQRDLPYQCDTSGKRFRRSSALTVHQVTRQPQFRTIPQNQHFTAFPPNIATFIIYRIHCAEVKPSILVHEFTNSCILKGHLSE